MCLWTEVGMAGSEIGDLPFTQFPFAALSFIPCVQSVTYSSKLGEQDIVLQNHPESPRSPPTGQVLTDRWGVGL